MFSSCSPNLAHSIKTITKMQRKPIFLPCFLVLALSVWMNCLAAETSLHFTNITTENGLVHNGVYSILEDSQGFLWYGTRNGLSRYDGSHFLNFVHNPIDPTSLPGDHITCMIEDHEGLIWVGTEHGKLASYNSLSESFTQVLFHNASKHSNKLNSITSLLCDSQGNIWVGSEYGLMVIHRDSGEQIMYYHDPDDPSSICDSHITALHEYPQGTLWAGTRSNALVSIDIQERSFRNIQKAPLILRPDGVNYISGIVSDTSRHCLWLSIFPEGFLRFEIDGEEIRQYGYEINHPKLVNMIGLLDIDIDQYDMLWLSSVVGLTQFDPDREMYSFYERSADSKYGFAGKVVNSLLFDSQGILWAATNSNGINRCKLDQVRFQHFQHDTGNPNGLSSNDVYGLMVDKSGDLWVSTVGGGTNRMNIQKGTNQLYRTDDVVDEWSMNYVSKTIQDQKENFWIATFQAGANHIDAISGERTLYRHDPGDSLSIGHSDIYSISETRDGHIWLGTNGGGLYEYFPDEQVFKSYQHNPEDSTSIPGDIIFSILEDQQDVLWVGTADAGLCRMDRDSGTFLSYQSTGGEEPGLLSNHILHLYEDRESNIWIGARNAGLTMLNAQRDQFKHIDLGWQPTELEVSGILESGSGNLWLSTNQGILKVDPDEGLLNAYGASDGVQGEDFKFGACAMDAEGFMYFGGANGFNRFHPDSIRDNTHIPPVRLTKLWVNNEVVKIGDEIENQVILTKSITHTDRLVLNYRHKVLRFEFAALDFVDPSRNRYAYQMSPFDEEWVYSDAQKAVTYTSLDPGEYTFRIKATNNDGIWNKTGTSLQILIKPPFWKTAWFRAGIVLFIVGLFLFIMWLRLNRLQAQKHKLEALVRERTVQLKLSLEEKQRTEIEKVEMQMDHLKRELLTKTMHLNEKQQIMDSMQSELVEITKIIPSNSRTGLKKLLRFLKDRTSVHQGWQEFELWFTEVHSSFFDNLRHSYPELSDSELKVCALLRLNLVSKDIAKVMNIQPRSIHIYRHRIRKKMNLDGEEQLTDVLSRF